MPILGSRMTETGRAQSVHKACTLRAPLAGALLAGAATAAPAASAWDMFVARCLDPYENLALAIHAGLDQQPAEQMREGQTVFGPTPEGHVMTINVLPDEGERACAVRAAGESRGDVTAFAAWRAEAVLSGRYAEDSDGTLLSGEWIEPRLRVDVQQGTSGARYEVIETELES